jgi:hypothetical protein
MAIPTKVGGVDLILLPGKLSLGLPQGSQKSSSTVPQTDTGGQVEKTKTIGRKRIKELGKKTRRKLCKMPSHASGRSESLFSDCLSKTQVPAKPKGKV